MTTEAYIYDAIRTPRGKGKAGGSLYEVKPIELVTTLLACVVAPVIVGQLIRLAPPAAAWTTRHKKALSLSAQIGVLLMAKAGYDPSEAPQFWERFSQAKEGGAPIEFLSTHPSDARRAMALRELLPEAMEQYNAAPEKLGLGVAIEDTVKLGI